MAWDDRMHWVYNMVLQRGIMLIAELLLAFQHVVAPAPSQGSLSCSACAQESDAMLTSTDSKKTWHNKMSLILRGASVLRSPM